MKSMKISFPFLPSYQTYPMIENGFEFREVVEVWPAQNGPTFHNEALIGMELSEIKEFSENRHLEDCTSSHTHKKREQKKREGVCT